MKKLWKLMLCFFLGGTLVACGDTPEERRNHLNAAMFWISTTLDPASNYDGWVLSRIGVGETLVKLNENYEVVPGLADTYEQINATTWHLHIREHLNFSNGKAVDGEDVKACLERAFAKNSRAKEYFDLAAVEAEGQDVMLYLNTPSGAVLNNLCEPLFTIYDASQSDDVISRQPSCTGPFVITDFKPEISVDCVANENYWDGEVQLASVHFVQVADADARVLALQNGEVDMVTTIDYSNVSLFSDPEKYSVSEVLGPRCNVVYLNHESPFLQDVHIRKALSYAVDRNSIVALTGGDPAVGLYSTALPYGNDVKNGYPLDLDKANQILDKAGYIDTDQDGIREMNGQNIVLQYYESADHGSSDANIIAQSIQSDAAKIGLSIEIKAVENLSDIKASGTFDMCSANDSTAPTGDPEIFLQLHYLSDASGNISRYKNAQIDALINELSVTFDNEKRQALAKTVSEMLLEDAVNLYVSYLPLNTICLSKVKGAVQHPVDYYMMTKDISIDNG